MDHAPGATHEALPLDPENDIDARSATRWVVGGAVVFFVALWLMVPIFVQVADVEHNRKVNQAPTTELNEIKQNESDFLNGNNPTKKKIADVIDSMRR